MGAQSLRELADKLKKQNLDDIEIIERMARSQKMPPRYFIITDYLSGNRFALTLGKTYVSAENAGGLPSHESRHGDIACG